MFRFKDLFVTFPTLGWLNRQLGIFLAPGGKILLVATLFFAFGSMHLDSPVYILCGASITLFAISIFVTRFFRPDLSVHFSWPDYAIVGEPVGFDVVIENKGEREAFDLELSTISPIPQIKIMPEQQNYKTVSDLPSGRKEPVRFVFQPESRGKFNGPEAKIRSAFPLHLNHTIQRFSSDVGIPVIPPIHDLLSENFIHAHHLKNQGPHSHSFAIAEQELIGSREYAPGINTKRIDYGAWARHRAPYVFQYDDESNRSAILIFDSYQEIHDERLFSGAISLVLSVVTALQAHQYSIDVSVPRSAQPSVEISHNNQNFAQLAKIFAELQPAAEANQPSHFQYEPNQLTILVSTNLDRPLLLMGDSFTVPTSPILSILVARKKTDLPLSDGFNHVISMNEIEAGAVRL